MALNCFRSTTLMGNCNVPRIHDVCRRARREFEVRTKERGSMTNAVIPNEMSLSSIRRMSTKAIGKRRMSAADAAKTVRHRKAAGRRVAARLIDQALLGGLLDPKSSSLSLTALAQAAASSGKRLILEIRDENPVRIIRTSSRPEDAPLSLPPLQP
jgi:hypothetical protein